MKTIKWLQDAKWGVFFHFLVTIGDENKTVLSKTEWDKRVDGFDVPKLTKQLKETGAGYFFITIGQNSGHYCSPNRTYRELVGVEQDLCSDRDLVSDLADSLLPEGIRLLVYLPSGAPAKNHAVCELLEWEWGFEGGWPHGHEKRTHKRLATFQRRWEAVIREWSLRWGRNVSGWWIDGCYFAEDMYDFPDTPNFASFAAALKAGNPESIVAFNPGVKVPVISQTEVEDYTPGEISNALQADGFENLIQGPQLQILSYLGENWGLGEPRFPVDLVTGYTACINAAGGAVTWDVPVNDDGTIPEPFYRQLCALGTKISVRK